ncbi:MAG: GCN5-related N-acetyltransferase [Frankiales bacterium]|nr:GCN5-related N-acetyltransferase [Frankiales bacterium]
MRPVPFGGPDAAGLLDAFGAEMDARYPGSEPSRAEPGQFDGPVGVFLVDGDPPVACAGLRPLGDGVGEVKRMYVAPEARGRGLARALLRALADHARGQGLERLVLECGTAQPEAVALYESEGWTPVPPYGQYRDDPRCRCYGLDLA